MERKEGVAMHLASVYARFIEDSEIVEKGLAVLSLQSPQLLDR